ncbi:MAG TPA: hypothetical protein VK699_21675 [Terriglobales bacterium]|nr:hypothetical protein [Terriglobales bacterium]
MNNDFVEAGSVDLRFYLAIVALIELAFYLSGDFAIAAKPWGWDCSLRSYMARLLHFGMAYFPREISSSTPFFRS